MMNNLIAIVVYISMLLLVHEIILLLLLLLMKQVRIIIGIISIIIYKTNVHFEAVSGAFSLIVLKVRSIWVS